ncbi:MAG: D-alanine--D-alanine ligase, partial [Zetaproteobacteria bacterium]
MGGRSREREVSLRSGAAVAKALSALGFDVVPIDLKGDWAQAIREARIEVAFVALHGAWGEDGCVQGLLEIMGIPYTGSGPAASALCMHKRLCKRVLAAHGVRVPQDMPLQDGVPVRFPVVIKPVNEGSSIDLAIVSGSDEWKAYAARVRGAPERWLVEERVQGVEVAVGVLEGEALVPVEVRPRRGVYDYTAKYTPGETEYLCPPKLPAETIRRCMQVAEEAVRVCGCRGAPRVDMIV